MLLIIPGWMHDAAQWNTVSELLDRNNVEHQVLDIPGFGTVPCDENLQTIDDLATWCKEQIDIIKITTDTPLVLFGHSCGGRIALQLVADGLAVNHLILCGSPNLYRPSLKTRAKKLLATLGAPFKSYIPERLREKLRSDDYEAVRGSDLQDLYTDVVRDDQTDLLGSITVATTLLWGELDEAAPLWIGRELGAKLPTATLEILPKLGHNLHHENPGLLAGKLTCYVKTA
jgi:pimeloyl-ACP methyl ester carboxylesterase